MRSPCQNCPDRYIGCHDHCGAYLSFHEQRKAQNEERHKQNEAFGYAREAERKKLSRQKYTKGKRYQSIR